ncbi:MAG: hypothetical protein HLX51_12835 [Micrococcaceae bacterium]|nr:hypothetical protein [Micrococcaceae bacterium]
MVREDAEQMSLEEQYEAAGLRYEEFNERFGQVQTKISDDGWFDGGSRSEIVPGAGGSLNRAPTGATQDNSYYFRVQRYLYTDQSLDALRDDIAASWEDRGWEIVSQGDETSGSARITAVTPEGFWFAAAPDPQQDRLTLTGHSPVYWGTYQLLIEAIAERRREQTQAGETWDTEDRDEQTGRAPRLPGEYRPFPAWELSDGSEPEVTLPPEPWAEDQE